MSYTPPDRHALEISTTGGYTPADRHALEIHLPAAPPPELGLEAGQARQTTDVFGVVYDDALVDAGQAAQAVAVVGAVGQDSSVDAGQAAQTVAVAARTGPQGPLEAGNVAGSAAISGAVGQAGIIAAGNTAGGAEVTAQLGYNAAIVGGNVAGSVAGELIRGNNGPIEAGQAAQTAAVVAQVANLAAVDAGQPAGSADGTLIHGVLASVDAGQASQTVAIAAQVALLFAGESGQAEGTADMLGYIALDAAIDAGNLQTVDGQLIHGQLATVVAGQCGGGVDGEIQIADLAIIDMGQVGGTADGDLQRGALAEVDAGNAAGVIEIDAALGMGAVIEAGNGAQSVDVVAAIAFWRAIVAEAASRWARRGSPAVESECSVSPGDAADADVALVTADGLASDRAISSRWGEASVVDRGCSAAFNLAEPLTTSFDLPWSAAPPHDIDRGLPWLQSDAQDAERSVSWANPPPRDIERGLAWDEPESVDIERLLQAQHGDIRDREARAPWGQGDAPPWVYLLTPPAHPQPPPPPLCYPIPDRHAVAFEIGDRGNPYVPPDRHALTIKLDCVRPRRRFDLRRTLSVSHSLSVVRLPDRLPLAVTSVSMSTDRDSWCWSVQITFANASSALAVEPTPEGYQTVEITLDGYVWTAAIESYSEDRSFGSRKISASGRSRTAAIAAPNYPQRAYTSDSAMTAQQLALRELEFTDFALDWQLPIDWVVPAGVWTYSAETPLSAIGKIAASCGAMVQSAPDSDTLIVAPRQVAAPWRLGDETVDFTLAGGSWLRLARRYSSGAGYKGAIVCGQSQGVTVIAFREGTGGSPYAPQVVDPLITDTAPGAARATNVVSDSLARQEIPVELPLIPSPGAPGLLLPGELGELEDTVWGTYRAVVDQLQVSAAVDSNGLLTARQNATLWRYLP